jgi:hypothetical protein
LQTDFAGILLEIFFKTQHFSKEAGRPGKILQFQMQFATKPLDFGSWIFFCQSTHIDLSYALFHEGVFVRVLL